MSDEGFAFITGLMMATVLCLVVAAYVSTDYVATKEAFDHGYMVECLGKEGYFWECEYD